MHKKNKIKKMLVNLAVCLNKRAMAPNNSSTPVK
jgi:hypothetical protein